MRIEKSSATVFTPLNNGTGVLLNLDSLFYYSLNRTAATIWQQIEREAPITLDELIRSTCERFEVQEEAARRDVGNFVLRLEELKVVRVT